MPKQSTTTKSTTEGRVERAIEGMVAFPGAESPSSFSDIPVYGAPARIGRFIPFVEEMGGPVESQASQMQAMVTGATVIRFHQAAKRKGVSTLCSAGFKVASVTDFQRTGLPEELEADQEAIYFERFGIAIIKASDPVKSLSIIGSNPNVASHRPERIYRALGMPRPPEHTQMAGGKTSASRDYLRGYKAGVSALIDNFLAKGTNDLQFAAESSFDESALTWGLQATDAAASSFSGTGIRVAILDTGLDLNHPDFSRRSITSQSFIAGEQVQDGNGHGTHTAGTACGPLRPASLPRYGIAYDAEIVIAKVLSNTGFGIDRTIIGGMNWALDQKCDIISMSLGAEVQRGEAFIDDYEQIGQVCLDSGCLVVAAGGNDSKRPGFIAAVNSPANCPSILAVAAVDNRMQVAAFSAGSVNSGQSIDLAAPGVDVLSSWLGGYRRLHGTSMAAAHVAGIAALFAASDKRNRGHVLWNLILQRVKALALPATDIGRGFIQAP